MRKATGKIGLLLILCMLVSMLPASVATDNSEWLTGATEPADETPAADSFVYASAPSGDYIALSSEGLAASTAKDVPGPADIPDNEPVSGTFDSNRVSWEFNKISRTLTIKKTGTEAGEMPSFDDTDIPWKSYKGEITTIEIDSGITTTEPCTFSGYSILSSMTVPDKWTYSKGDLNILSDVDDASSASLAILKELVTEVVIDEGVTSIADNAFAGMKNLTESGAHCQPVVYFEGTKNQWKGINSDCTGAWGLMAEANKYLLVSCADGRLIGACGKAAPDDATFVFDGTDTLTISGNGSDSVEMGDFTSHTMPWYSVRGKIKNLDIGADIKTIGSYAFYSCTSLTGVEISENVTSIGNYAFSNCDNLENLTIKEGNTPLMIGMYVFWKCSSLKNIGSPATTKGTQQPGIPKRVKAIGVAAFRDTGLVYKKDGTAGHIYYEGTRDEWAKIYHKVDSPNVRDGRLLTGATSDDEDTYAIVHCMSTDSTDFLYHGLKFDGGHSSVKGDGPELNSIRVESSIVAKADAIKDMPDSDGKVVPKVAEDTNFKLPENIFERKGYTFNNWLCDADNEIYKPGEIFIMPAKDVVFTAQWTLDTPKKGDSIDQIVEYLTAEKTKGTSAYPWQAPQDAASSQTELMNWLYKKVPEYLDEAINASDNSEIKASYRIQVKYFYPAEMGIKNTPLGRNGRFDFDIHLTFKQEIENETKEIKTTAVIKNGVIKAIGYTTANDARYKVTFEFEGGILNRYSAPNHGYTIKEDTTVTWPYMSPGQTFKLPVCMDNTGKDRTFTGWKCSLSEDDFIYRANAPFLMRAGDVTFTAQWDPPSDAAETSLITANADHLKSLAALTGAESVSLKAAKVNPETPEVMQLRAASLEDDMIFVDLTLYETVNGKTSRLPDTDGNLIAITIPFDGENAENIRVYREHGGEIDCLTEGGSGERIAVADGSVTIYAAKFSIYAIAFDRKSSGTGGGASSGGSSGGSGGSSGGSSSGGSRDSRGSSGSSSKPGIISPAGGSSGSTPAGNVPNGGTPSGKRFNDVAPGAWYYEAANWAYDQKIAKGEGGKRLNPNKLCTRAEMLTFLWRALGSPAPSATGKTFTDVSSGAYYARAVQWAAGQKIVKGEGGKRFNPDAPVTRGEAITLLYRALGAPASAGARFNDVPESAYYAEAVEWAVSRDIAKGVGKRSFSPAAPCTRAQVLTFLYRSQS